jgi:hypothetical protein
MDVPFKEPRSWDVLTRIFSKAKAAKRDLNRATGKLKLRALFRTDQSRNRTIQSVQVLRS